MHVLCLLKTFKHEEMFRPGDSNPCHQLRSQTPTPLNYLYRYLARLIFIDKSLGKGTSLL